jgi:hypothetical protein
MNPVTDKLNEAKPIGGSKPPQPAAAETAEVNSDIHRILFDHEMERGGGTTKIAQPRRRRRLLKE